MYAPVTKIYLPGMTEWYHDYEMDKVTSEYLSRVQDAAQAIVPSILVLTNGQIICETSDVDKVLSIVLSSVWHEILDRIDLSEIASKYPARSEKD